MKEALAKSKMPVSTARSAPRTRPENYGTTKSLVLIHVIVFHCISHNEPFFELDKHEDKAFFQIRQCIFTAIDGISLLP